MRLHEYPPPRTCGAFNVCVVQVKIEMLGTADRIVVMKEQMTIVSDGRNDEAVRARIKTIRKDAETSDSAVSRRFCFFARVS